MPGQEPPARSALGRGAAAGAPTAPPVRPPPRDRGGRGGPLLLLVLACLALWAFLPGPVAADELDDQVRAIAKELRCPVCQGETVADSNAQISVQMRGIIREKLAAGESRDQIIQYFVDRYGEGILASPPRRGFTLGVWLAPVVALLVGLVVVGVVLRGWYRGTSGRLAPERGDTAQIAAPLPAGDDERLE